MEPPVQELMADTGALLDIRGARESGGTYSMIDVVFEHGVLRLSPDGDTDEIVAAVVSGDEAEGEDLAVDVALSGLVGNVVEHAWYLTNHRGYRDGFQLRLIDLADRSEVTRQFEVAASAIYVWIVRD